MPKKQAQKKSTAVSARYTPRRQTAKISPQRLQTKVRLSAHQMAALTSLLEEGGEIYRADGRATRALGVSNHVVRTLEQRGFVSRDSNQTRTYKISITAQGRKIVENAKDFMDVSSYQRFVTTLPEANEAYLAEITETIQKAVDNRVSERTKDLVLQEGGIIAEIHLAIHAVNEGEISPLRAIADIERIINHLPQSDQ